MPSVAAIVVTYNPDRSVIDNILNYIDEVDSVITVDNSESAFAFCVVCRATEMDLCSEWYKSRDCQGVECGNERGSKTACGLCLA